MNQVWFDMFDAVTMSCIVSRQFLIFIAFTSSFREPDTNRICEIPWTQPQSWPMLDFIQWTVAKNCKEQAISFHKLLSQFSNACWRFTPSISHVLPFTSRFTNPMLTLATWPKVDDEIQLYIQCNYIYISNICWGFSLSIIVTHSNLQNQWWFGGFWSHGASPKPWVIHGWFGVPQWTENLRETARSTRSFGQHRGQHPAIRRHAPLALRARGHRRQHCVLGRRRSRVGQGGGEARQVLVAWPGTVHWRNSKESAGNPWLLPSK